MSGSPPKLKEKRICRTCCIIFDKADRCPRCGKGENLEVYLDPVFPKKD